MSCGRPHELSCLDALARVYDYLDGEMDLTDRAKVRQHLEECAPCLKQFGLEDAVKALVRRACGCEEAPNRLRARVLTRINEVRLELQAD